MTWLCAAVAAVSFGAAEAAPKARVDTPSWRLEVKFHDPQRMVLRLPGDRHETTFWYVLYTVTNNTGMDREFFPSFRLVTDNFGVVEGGAHISPSVYDAVVDRHRREFPFMVSPTKVSGLLLQGEANERTSFVAFRDFDTRANAFSVFASGLSGKIERRANPAFDASKAEGGKNPRQFILRRTLEVRYDFPGDPQTRDRTSPIRRTRRWVMR